MHFCLLFCHDDGKIIQETRLCLLLLWNGGGVEPRNMLPFWETSLPMRPSSHSAKIENNFVKKIGEMSVIKKAMPEGIAFM